MNFEEQLTPEQLDLWRGLTTPAAIQAFLNSLAYEPAYTNRCPLRVLQDRRAHCLDGGIFAAAALRRLGYRPLIVDLLPEPGMDDDHVLAIYRLDGCFGAVAKSNFAVLRAHEPVFHNVRELVMSYFEVFYNVDGVKTLRGYTRPLNLAAFDRQEWLTSDAGVDAIERHLLTLRRTSVLTPAQVARLGRMDSVLYQAGMLGADPSGLYKPKAASSQ